MALGFYSNGNNVSIRSLGIAGNYFNAWDECAATSSITMVFFPRKFEEWYKKYTREEKIWISIAVLTAFILGVTTLAWPLIDAKHGVPKISNEVTPSQFSELARNFASNYNGKLVPPGVEVYIAGQQYSWSISKLVLQKGVEYTIWISSLDVLHGLSIVGNGVVYNLMVMPGMAYQFKISFHNAGVYYIICNEYCGYGHGNMRAIIEVVP